MHVADVVAFRVGRVENDRRLGCIDIFSKPIRNSVR